MDILPYEFYHRHALEVAPELVGKLLVHRGTALRISETEAYCGTADTACHASRGRTKRNEVLYADAGTVYVYLCYGMHWMMNVITGDAEDPQGVLIRACAEAPGPGKLTKTLALDRSLHGVPLADCSDTVWFEDDGLRPVITAKPRGGISYASAEDQARLWRFCADDLPSDTE